MSFKVAGQCKCCNKSSLFHRHDDIMTRAVICFLHRYSQNANHAFLKSEVIADGRESLDANSNTGKYLVTVPKHESLIV